MSEQRDKAKEKSRHHKERRERKRRKGVQVQSTTKATQTSQKAKEEAPEIKVSAQSEAKEDSRNQKKTSKAPEKSIKVEVTHRHHEVVIPTVLITSPTLEYTQVEVDSSYHVKRRQQGLKIPPIHVDSPIFEFQRMPLNGEFSMRKKVNVPAKFPKLKLQSSVFAITNSPLDSTVNIPSRPKHSLRSVPKTRTTEMIEQEERIHVTHSTGTEVLEIGTEKRKSETRASTIKAQKKTPDRDSKLKYQTALIHSFESEGSSIPSEPTRGHEKTEKTIDPLEALFGSDAGKIREIEPLVILFKDPPEDKYIDTFSELLLRIYREKHGGRPEIKKLTLRDEWNKEIVERYLDEGELLLIEFPSRLKKKDHEKYLSFDDFKQTQKKKGSNVDVIDRMIADRLWAVFSMKRGIVILYTRNEEHFENLKERIQNICSNLENKPDVVTLTPSALSTNKKIRLSRLLFGNVDLSEGELINVRSSKKELNISKSTNRPTLNITMDAVKEEARKRYHRILKDLNEKYSIIGIINEAEDEKGAKNESPEHYTGKAFIVNHLIKKLQNDGKVPKNFNGIKWDDVEENFIQTEQPINDKIIPDVTFVPEGEHYEFETLFGEGFSKISGRTLKKYYKYAPNSKVRIVVEPVTAFLHMREFSTLIKLTKKGQRFKGLDIEFYTLDVKNEELLNLKDYLKELNTFLKEIS